MRIPFNKPSFTGQELDYIRKSVLSGKISGDGVYTRKCQELLEGKLGAGKVLLTTSCTDALELASLLLDLKAGDEVIVPAYAFVSTVNAFMLRGAKPVFVDIRSDTKNIDEKLLERKITKKTKAICLIHYAGVACDMEAIGRIAGRHGLPIVEDAAQAVNAKYRGRFLGALGTFGCYSFHETKNYMCGEGGAIVLGDKNFIERAEILREKGTDRSKLARGEVDKYTWRDIGSSFLPSDILAAFLYAQLKKMDEISAVRKSIYDRYLDAFQDLQAAGRIELPFIPSDCSSNYHMFYLLLDHEADRDRLIRHLKERGIWSVFHYLPLHTSPMGLKLGYKKGDFPVTEDVSRRLVRLPFYNQLARGEQDSVIAEVREYLTNNRIKSPSPKSSEEPFAAESAVAENRSPLRRLKVVLMGNNRAAINCLDIVLADPRYEVLVVAPHGGKVRSWHESLYEHALGRGVGSVCDPENVNHPAFLRYLRSFRPDLILSVYYDQILKRELLRIPRLGCVNVHPSLLPKYRGVAPLIWAIIQDEKKTGISFHLMDEGIDTGDILMQEELPIALDDTGYSLHRKAAEKVKTMMGKFLEDTMRGVPWTPRKQKGGKSYYPQDAPARNFLDWDQSAVSIYNCVRALTAPLPGCFSYLKGEKINFWKVSVTSAASADRGKAARGLEAGRILLQQDKVLIKAASGWIELLEAGIAGIRMSGRELIGAKGLGTGDRFEMATKAAGRALSR